MTVCITIIDDLGSQGVIRVNCEHAGNLGPSEEVLFV